MITHFFIFILVLYEQLSLNATNIKQPRVTNQYKVGLLQIIALISTLRDLGSLQNGSLLLHIKHHVIRTLKPTRRTKWSNDEYTRPVNDNILWFISDFTHHFICILSCVFYCAVLSSVLVMLLCYFLLLLVLHLRKLYNYVEVIERPIYLNNDVVKCYSKRRSQCRLRGHVSLFNFCLRNFYL